MMLYRYVGPVERKFEVRHVSFVSAEKLFYIAIDSKKMWVARFARTIPEEEEYFIKMLRDLGS